MEEYMAVCRFCGQAVAADGNFGSKEEADEWASCNCECPDAVLYSSIEKSKEKARIYLNEFEGESLDIVCRAIGDVAFRKVEQITIKLGNKTVSLKLNADNRVVCNIKQTNNAKITL